MRPIQLWLPILNKFSNLILTNARSHPFLFKPGGWLRFCFNQKGMEYILAFNIRAAVEICLPQLHNLLSPPRGVNFCEPFFGKVDPYAGAISVAHTLMVSLDWVDQAGWAKASVYMAKNCPALEGDPASQVTFLAKPLFSFSCKRFATCFRKYLWNVGSPGTTFLHINGALEPLVLLVTDVSWASLMLGGFGSEALLASLENEAFPSAVRCATDRLFCCLIESTLQESQFHCPCWCC